MKKFTKLFLSCALVSVVAAAAATMAMADDVTFTANLTGEGLTNATAVYNATANTITISNITPKADTQATLLVYKGASTATEITDDAIYGIDQEEGVAFTKNGLKNNPTTTEAKTYDGTYTVKVGYYNDGGEFKVAVGTFDIGETVTPPPSGDTIKLIIGDVDLNKAVNSFDQTRILRKIANLTTNIGRIGEEFIYADDNADYAKLAEAGKYMVGDVDANGAVNSFDQTRILRKIANLTTNIGYIGETVTVEAKEDNGNYTVGD